MRANFLVDEQRLPELAVHLLTERKRQKLSREQAAAVCGVSVSFIRDAESRPEQCSFGKLVRYITGLGLTVDVSGFQVAQLPKVVAASADYSVAAASIEDASHTSQ